MEKRRSLADEIKRLRQALGMTQAEFADALQVEQATVSRWENGSEPSYFRIAMMSAIAERRGVRVDFGHQAEAAIAFTSPKYEIRRVPISGRLQENSIISKINLVKGEILNEIPVVTSPEVEVVAILVDTDDLMPIIDRNSILLFGTKVKPINFEDRYGLCLVQMAGGAQLLGRVIRSHNKGKWHVISSTIQTFDLDVDTVRPFMGSSTMAAALKYAI